MGWGAKERGLLILLASMLALSLNGLSSGNPPLGSEPVPSLILDANTAPAEVFGALPGLGPALSGRIVEARELLPFTSMDDLDRRIKGIGPAKAASIRPFLRFDPIPSR